MIARRELYLSNHGRSRLYHAEAHVEAPWAATDAGV